MFWLLKPWFLLCNIHLSPFTPLFLVSSGHYSIFFHEITFFQLPPVREFVLWYSFFCDQFIPLNTVSFSSIHFVVIDRNQLFFFYLWVIFHFMYVLYFLYPLIYRVHWLMAWLGYCEYCLKKLGSVDIYLIRCFHFLWYIIRLGIAGFLQVLLPSRVTALYSSLQILYGTRQEEAPQWRNDKCLRRWKC